MRLCNALLCFFILGGCGLAYKPHFQGQQSAPEKRVTFIGQDNNRTNGYTRTLITINPLPNVYVNVKPFVISVYPIPEQVYVSCSNFRNTRPKNIEYRKSYIYKYKFEPGKFYKFDCHKKNSDLSGEYSVNMQILDAMPKLKSKW